MPCNTDYMEPHGEEIKNSQIMCIYDYLFYDKPINKNHWQGYHPKIYSQSYDKYVDPPKKLTMRRVKFRVETILLGFCNKEIQELPLEIQIWWRDRLEKIKESRVAAKEELKRIKLRKQAIAKLTKEEQEALGLI